MQLAIFRSQSAQYVQNMYVGTMEISASEPRGAAWNAKRRRPETPASPQPPVNPQLALALLPCNVVNAASSNSKAIRLPTPEGWASLLPPPPLSLHPSVMRPASYNSHSPGSSGRSSSPRSPRSTVRSPLPSSVGSRGAWATDAPTAIVRRTYADALAALHQGRKSNVNTRWIGLGAGRDLLRGRMPFPAARCFSVACGRPAFVMCPIGVPPFEITCAFAVTWDRTGEAEGISRVSMLAMLSSPSFPFPPIPVLVQSFIPIQPQVQPRKALRMAIAIAECQRRSFGYGAAGGTPGGEVHEVGKGLRLGEGGEEEYDDCGRSLPTPDPDPIFIHLKGAITGDVFGVKSVGVYPHSYTTRRRVDPVARGGSERVYGSEPGWGREGMEGDGVGMWPWPCVFRRATGMSSWVLITAWCFSSSTGMAHFVRERPSAEYELRFPHLLPTDPFVPSTGDRSKETSRLIGSCSAKMPSRCLRFVDMTGAGGLHVVDPKLNVELVVVLGGRFGVHTSVRWRTDDLKKPVRILLSFLPDPASWGADVRAGHAEEEDPWNKFCFTGGMAETVASLPRAPNIVGPRPAGRMLGLNLGRAGYGASLGTWPYTYDDGASNVNGELSYLPGQRLSRCTCPVSPTPSIYTRTKQMSGAPAPVFDIFEAQIPGTPLTGQVSQSGQWAPFNEGYVWPNTSANLIIPNHSISLLHSDSGWSDRQAMSVVTNVNEDCYRTGTQCFNVYGIEYKPGFDDMYISWIGNGALVWTINAAGVGADTTTEISTRPIG
ncbi:glycoside hydrolase family 16 protein [Athelia psychrophila]|uniref:Glycoside hydrolase family 16 protein n=1 Tax=Athelia psychrophila TaxID=1759441 RepID=A0A166DE15_9AGAM|nr:glycoside hydrolase family 16 protein [Fibularhizoctonia sp. CBS 109695]